MRLNPLGRRLLTTKGASRRMAGIRQCGTMPEEQVRKILGSLGLRFVTAHRSLPGSPDFANRRRRLALFVHGCYWHSHCGCRLATIPKSNREFWISKFARNRQRDRRVQAKLRRMGFRVVVVWQCQLATPTTVRRRLLRLFRVCRSGTSPPVARPTRRAQRSILHDLP